MNSITLKRPSAAMIVAVVALFVAMGGVGYAASVIGSAAVKNNSLRSIDIRNETLKGQDVNEATLGKVPSAASADSAQNAQNAQSAQTAQTAVSAQSAGNADTLDGIDSAGFVQAGTRSRSVSDTLEDPNYGDDSNLAQLTNLGEGRWTISAKLQVDNDSGVAETVDCDLVKNSIVDVHSIRPCRCCRPDRRRREHPQLRPDRRDHHAGGRNGRSVRALLPGGRRQRRGRDAHRGAQGRLDRTTAATQTGHGGDNAAVPVHVGHLRFSTEGDCDAIDLTQGLLSVVAQAGIENGIVSVFVPGLTAAITTMERHQPGGVHDLRAVLDRLVPHEGDYEHNKLNHDTNSHAHIRAAIVGPSEVPFRFETGGSRRARGSRWC